MHTRALESPAGTFRRVLIAVLATALALSGWAAIQSSRADAALEAGTEYAVVGGHVDWGVRTSFRNYITGPIAKGAIAVGDGTTVNTGGTYRFPALSGSALDDAVDVTSGGFVHFTGHEGQLDFRVENVRVQIDGDEGVLIADAISKSLEDAELVEFPDTVFADLDLSGVTPVVDGDTLTLAGIPATLTEDGAPAFADFYPAGDPLDPVTLVLDLEEVEPPVEWDPHVTVSKSTDVDYGGETVTVTGTGFDPFANISTRPPIPVGSPTGVYVVFGKFADTWKPSESAPSTARRVIDQKWALPQVSLDQVAPNPAYVVLEEDGSFETTLHLAPNEALPEDFDYGIVTYAAGGPINADQETFTPVTFADPPPVWEPQITVSKTTDVDPSGETVTVTGSGFDPDANISTGTPPVPAGYPRGVFVVFGKFADTWKPSEGAPSSARRQIDTKWPLPQASIDAIEAIYGPDARYVPLQSDGSFETTLTLKTDESLPEDFDYGIATYAGGIGAANADQESFTPVTFADPPVVWEPQVTVSKSTDVDYGGETVTVTGTGFDPSANISTRPPVPVGLATGVYVVFGKFADTWQPSQGAPSSARRVIDQMWPLPAASKAAAEAAFGPNPQYAILEPDGSFQITLDLAPNEALPEDFDYGIVTYAAGGAAPNASQETFTPVTFADPPAPEPIRIEGTVTDTSGDPVEGALVMAYQDGDTWFGSIWDYTDADGFYSLDAEPGVGYAVHYVSPAGSNLIRAWAVRDGDTWSTTTERTPSDVVVVDEDHRVEVIDVALARGGTVEGRITDAEGIGVPGVEVWLYRDTDSWVGFQAGVTDENGDYRIEGVIPVDSTVPATEFRVQFRPPAELGFGTSLWYGGTTRSTATLLSVGLDETIGVSVGLGGTAAQ